MNPSTHTASTIDLHWHKLLSTRPCMTLAIALMLITSMLTPPTFAASDPVYTLPNRNDALEGYDPVAYFSEGRPVKGSDNHSLNYLGANWYFSSRKNLDAFATDPELYAPRYGGYCAFAMATGDKIKGDPEYWEIVDDKLYLNINRDIHRLWSADKRRYISRADKIWPAALN